MSWSYTVGGRPKERTWHRKVGSIPLKTTWLRDPKTAEIVGIDYSDDTPDVAFSYDRQGRLSTVSDASGDRAFGYCPSRWGPVSETIVASESFERTIERTIDHNIIANCINQFYGQAGSPAAIGAIQGQLKQRGGSGRDIASMGTGKFYIAMESIKSPLKIKTPLCLAGQAKGFCARQMDFQVGGRVRFDFVVAANRYGSEIESEGSGVRIEFQDGSQGESTSL